MINSLYSRVMAFEQAGKYLFKAANTFHMQEQALSGVMCQCARNVIKVHYKEHVNHWDPIGFESHTLTIQTKHASASSKLYMVQIELLEKIQKEESPASIRELKIIRK